MSVVPARAPYVFVINMPMHYDRKSGVWMRKIDLGPAAEYGEMVFLTPHGHPPHNKTIVLPRMADFLERFTENDYLLPAGPPIYMCWAAAIAAQKTGGRLKILMWNRGDDPQSGLYTVVDASLFVLPPLVHNDGTEIEGIKTP